MKKLEIFFLTLCNKISISFSHRLKVNLKKVKKLYNKKLSSPTEYHIQKHREYKKMPDKLKRKAKQEYYHSNFSNSKNPKKTWEIINSLTETVVPLCLKVLMTFEWIWMKWSQIWNKVTIWPWIWPKIIWFGLAYSTAKRYYIYVW